MTGASDPATVARLDDSERIALQLTEPQRRWLLKARPREGVFYTYPPSGTYRVLQAMGLVEQSGRLTLFGLAVRHELERNAP